MLSPAFEERFRKITFGIPWNIFLLTLGSLLIAFSIKAIAVPHGLLAGGMGGFGLLLYYIVGGLTPGQWYFLLNVPVFILGWVFISRRFFLYSLYGMLISTVFLEMITYTMPVQDIWLAVLACGSIMGVGVGMTLRTLGSTGGSDILAVICKEKLNMSMGTFEFWFNVAIFLAGFAWLDPSIMLYSIAMTFVTAAAIDHVMNMFGEREMVMIISEHPQQILQVVSEQLQRGATILEGKGGYTGSNKEVVMTMIASVQLKQLEEAVYAIDPDAFTIMGSGFRVLGRGFSARKVY